MEESYPHSEMLLVYDCMGKSRATTSCKSAWDTTVFWLRWPVRDLVLVTPPPPPKPSLPPPPLIIVANNTRPCSKLGGTTFNGREEGSQNKKFISQTGDQQRFEARKVAFWSESLKILQLVVAAVSGSSTVRGKVKLLVSYFTVDVLCNDDHRPLPSYKTLTFKLKASAQYFP